MSGETKIQWSDCTWGPTRGCSIVSPGCHNCYAMRQAHRFNKPGQWAEGLTKATKNGPQWSGKVVLSPEKTLAWPLRYKGHPGAIKEGRPTRIFVNSMSDLFHESLSPRDIFGVFAVMADAPQHTFQVLTKRAGRMRQILADMKPLPNVWLGVSAENQDRYDERILDLQATPAAVRFVSAEPLLGPIDLHQGGLGSQDRLHWVIVGGESGPGARLCDVAWIRSIKDQCEAAGVACFVKQLGRWPAVSGEEANTKHPTFKALEFGLKDKKGGDPSEWPADLRVREMPR